MHKIMLISEGPQYNVVLSTDVKYETKSGFNGKQYTEATFNVACGNGAKKKEDGTFETKDPTFYQIQVTGEGHIKHLQSQNACKGMMCNIVAEHQTWSKKKDDGTWSNGNVVKVGGDDTLFVFKPQTKEQLQQPKQSAQPQQNVQQNTQPAQQNTQYAPQQGYQQPYNGPVNNGYPQQGYQQPYNGPANGGYAPNYQQQPYNNGYPAQAQSQPAQNVGGSGRLDISSNDLPFY